MDNVTRVKKLEQAKALLREVEFSYSEGDPNRKYLFNSLINSFGPLGSYGSYMNDLKQRFTHEELGKYYGTN